MLASCPASMLNQNRADSGIPNRFRPKASRSRAQSLAAAAAAEIGCPRGLDGVEVFVRDGFLGAGYGIPCAEGQNAIAVTARAEGVLLDPTYTGKTMAAYRKLVSQGRYAGIETASEALALAHMDKKHHVLDF